MSGLIEINKTITLLIIAKSSWNEGYCYLGYDQSTNRILRPIISPNHDSEPEVSTPQPWDYDFEVGAYYTFELPAFLDFDHANNYSVGLPHMREDLLVLEDIVSGPMVPWVKPLDPNKSGTAASQRHPSPLYKMLRPFAKDSIEDIFDLHFNYCERYIRKGTDCPSLGILRCWKSSLEWCPDHKARIKIRGPDHGEDRVLPLTTPSFVECRDFLTSGNEKESVLVIISLGRPFTANLKFRPPRCYLLVVGMVRKHVYDKACTHPQATV